MKKTHALISFLVCFLQAGTCVAYDLVGTAALSEELVAQHYTINPNLDAVIVVDRTIPTFEYHTYYSAGSADEEEGKQGRLHFLEYIMAGTGSHEYGKLNQIINENGGQSNAYTSSHFTYFVMRFPKDKIDLAVEIDSDRYYHTVINKEVVEKEKRIVLTEISSRQSDLQRNFSNRFWEAIKALRESRNVVYAHIHERLPPQRRLYNEVYRAIYNPPRRKDGYKSLTDAEVRAFLEKFFVPENMIMIFVGPKDHIIDILNKHLPEVDIRVHDTKELIE